jgi:hypothetical protein
MSVCESKVMRVTDDEVSVELGAHQASLLMLVALHTEQQILSKVKAEEEG